MAKGLAEELFGSKPIAKAAPGAGLIEEEDEPVDEEEAKKKKALARKKKLLQAASKW